MEPKTLPVRDFYSKVWAEYADPVHHPITAQALATQARFVGRRIREAKPRRVLDLGCGPSPVIQADSAPLVVCADLVFDMLAKIRKNRQGFVVCLDAQRLPFAEHCFDFIWCGLLVDHIEDTAGWLQELLRLLEAGATLGMACWTRSELPAERYPDNRQMRYTTAKGEELAVTSFPTWEVALELLRQMDPAMDTEVHVIVPDEYLLQVAWVRVPAA